MKYKFFQDLFLHFKNKYYEDQFEFFRAWIFHLYCGNQFKLQNTVNLVKNSKLDWFLRTDKMREVNFCINS